MSKERLGEKIRYFADAGTLTPRKTFLVVIPKTELMFKFDQERTELKKAGFNSSEIEEIRKPADEVKIFDTSKV